MSDPRIPEEVFDQVHQLVVDIANAALAEDKERGARHYAALQRYCEERTARDGGLAFLWESLGDVTADASERRVYYDRALQIATRTGEQSHTILLELGTLYAAAGETTRARETLDAASRLAAAAADTETVAAAAVQLRRLPPMLG